MEGETVIAGVDTHKDVHVLCLLDGLGRKIWSGGFRADPEGYDRLAECWYGRSYADSPEVDGKVFFIGSGARAGEFVNVRITDTVDGDLMGETVE